MLFLRCLSLTRLEGGSRLGFIAKTSRPLVIRQVSPLFLGASPETYFLESDSNREGGGVHVDGVSSSADSRGSDWHGSARGIPQLTYSTPPSS